MPPTHWLALLGSRLGLTYLLATAGATSISDGGAGRGPQPPSAPRPPPSLLAIPPRLDTAGHEPGPDDYRLRRAQDGSGDLLYDASGFSARVARDGMVSFHDHHGSVISLLPFLPGPAPAGVPTLQSTLRDLGKKRRAEPRGASPRDPAPDETRDPSTTVSRYRPDPREACQYPLPCFFDAPVVQLGGRFKFDITDELIRLAGQDPYRYDKARFLAATREMRTRMAGRAHAEDLARSGGELPARLRTIACDPRRQPAERRAIIEQLRAELDVATPEGRAHAAEITGFLEALAHPDAGADLGLRCPPS
jgi:hypothetical protein